MLNDSFVFDNEPTAVIQGSDQEMIAAVNALPVSYPVRRLFEHRVLYRDPAAPVRQNIALAYYAESTGALLPYNAVAHDPQRSLLVYEAAAWQTKLDSFHEYMTEPK
jgi:hypothetical protein